VSHSAKVPAAYPASAYNDVVMEVRIGRARSERKEFAVPKNIVESTLKTRLYAARAKYRTGSRQQQLSS